MGIILISTSFFCCVHQSINQGFLILACQHHRTSELNDVFQASKWGNQHNSRASFPTNKNTLREKNKKQPKKVIESFELPSISGKSRTFFKSLLVTIETKRSSASRIKSFPTLVNGWFPKKNGCFICGVPKSWWYPSWLISWKIPKISSG